MLTVLHHRRVADQVPMKYSTPGVPRSLQGLPLSDAAPARRDEHAGSDAMCAVGDEQMQAAGSSSEGILQLPGGDANGLLRLLHSWPGHAESDPGTQEPH